MPERLNRGEIHRCEIHARHPGGRRQGKHKRQHRERLRSQQRVGTIQAHLGALEIRRPQVIFRNLQGSENSHDRLVAQRLAAQVYAHEVRDDWFQELRVVVVHDFRRAHPALELDVVFPIIGIHKGLHHATPQREFHFSPKVTKSGSQVLVMRTLVPR